ncbi:MAG: RNA 2',3'-cyclic phosphodiesterase [Planctomycetota bacterium]|nr:MAG: RNA 2',3'-cyclic phosphodiesterase [Planctomycetota bacterium]
MARRLRLFIAVDVPGETVVLARRLIERLRKTGIEARWADPARLHLTLWFLGNVAAEEMPAICRAMDRAGAATLPIDLEIVGAGAFPDAANPRTLWLGVRGGAEGLVALHEALAGELNPLGYPAEDRRYRPHITLGRVRHGDPEATQRLAAELAALAELPVGAAGVDSFTLYASLPGRDGPQYEVIHASDLTCKATRTHA